MKNSERIRFAAFLMAVAITQASCGGGDSDDPLYCKDPSTGINITDLEIAKKCCVDSTPTQAEVCYDYVPTETTCYYGEGYGEYPCTEYTYQEVTCPADDPIDDTLQYWDATSTECPLNQTSSTGGTGSSSSSSGSSSGDSSSGDPTIGTIDVGIEDLTNAAIDLNEASALIADNTHTAGGAATVGAATAGTLGAAKNKKGDTKGGKAGSSSEIAIKVGNTGGSSGGGSSSSGIGSGAPDSNGLMGEDGENANADGSSSGTVGAGVLSAATGGHSGKGKGGKGSSSSDSSEGGDGKGKVSDLNFGAGSGGDLTSSLSEDPEDYFTRIGLEDSIFKIVERRYRQKASDWGRPAVHKPSVKKVEMPPAQSQKLP